MRVLSWNIHKGIGGRDRRYRLDRIVEVIRSEAPDIACLQEVDSGVPRSDLHDQPTVLAEQLGFPHHRYQRNVDVKDGGYGNLVLSHHPISWSEDLNLRLKWRKPRAAQLCGVDTPEGRLFLVNWHLGLAEHERRWQVHTLLQNERVQAHASAPTLIIGDFNDWRDRLHSVVFQAAGFTYITSPPAEFRSFPAYMPLGALDKAFCRGDIHATSAHVVKTPETRDASDHLPLVLELVFGPQSLDPRAETETVHSLDADIES